MLEVGLAPSRGSEPVLLVLDSGVKTMVEPTDERPRFDVFSEE